jgi:hypothetical protein
MQVEQEDSLPWSSPTPSELDFDQAELLGGKGEPILYLSCTAQKFSLQLDNSKCWQR